MFVFRLIRWESSALRPLLLIRVRDGLLGPDGPEIICHLALEVFEPESFCCELCRLARPHIYASALCGFILKYGFARCSVLLAEIIGQRCIVFKDNRGSESSLIARVPVSSEQCSNGPGDLLGHTCIHHNTGHRIKPKSRGDNNSLNVHIRAECSIRPQEL